VADRRLSDYLAILEADGQFAADQQDASAAGG
jgi:hypothetical protein